MKIPSVENLVELAKEAAAIDPVDWQNLKISPEQAFYLMASNVVEQFDQLPSDNRLVIAMATITKLLVENFVLHVKLKQDK